MRSTGGWRSRNSWLDRAEVSPQSMQHDTYFEVLSISNEKKCDSI